MVRICRVADTQMDEGQDFHMPVFVFVCTKMKIKMPKPVSSILDIFQLSGLNLKNLPILLNGVLHFFMMNPASMNALLLQILEVVFFEDASAERFGSVDDVIAAIKQVQQYGLVRSRLNKG